MKTILCEQCWLSATFSPSAISDHIADAERRDKFLNLPRVRHSK